MSILSTGPIENNPVGGIRPTKQIAVKIVNRDPVNSSNILIQGYVLNGSRNLYVSELFAIGSNQVITRTYFADLNAFAFDFTTGGSAANETDISIWGKNAVGQLVTVHRLVSSESLRA